MRLAHADPSDAYSHCDLHKRIVGSSRKSDNEQEPQPLGQWENCSSTHSDDAITPSLHELFRNVASVLGQFLQHRLVQPHIHLSRIAHFLSWASQFSRQFFSGD